MSKKNVIFGKKEVFKVVMDDGNGSIYLKEVEGRKILKPVPARGLFVVMGKKPWGYKYYMNATCVGYIVSRHVDTADLAEGVKRFNELCESGKTDEAIKNLVKENPLIKFPVNGDEPV